MELSSPHIIESAMHIVEAMAVAMRACNTGRDQLFLQRRFLNQIKRERHLNAKAKRDRAVTHSTSINVSMKQLQIRRSYVFYYGLLDSSLRQ